MEKEITTETLLDNRYKIIKLLGQGGMGKVYLVQDERLHDQQIALKLLSREYVKDERAKERFLREVVLARKISHSNIARTHDIGECPEGLYLTMEYLEGQSLKQIVARGPIETSYGLRIAREILQGLRAIHEAGIIHRDLKSANIMVSKSGEVKITDFGIASPGYSELTESHEIIGSCQYMAPELWSGSAASARSDLYAYGVVLYEVFCGILPFEGIGGHELMFKHLKVAPTEPLEIVESVSVELNNLILNLLAKDPVDRPENAAAVLDQLTRIQENPFASNLLIDSYEEEFLAEQDAEYLIPAQIESTFSTRQDQLAALNNYDEDPPLLDSSSVLSPAPHALPTGQRAFLGLELRSVFVALLAGSLVYFMVGYLSQILVPMIVGLGDILHRNTASSPYLQVVLGLALILSALPFFALQFLGFGYLIRFSGGVFTLKTILKLMLAVVVVGLVFSSYYLTIFGLQWAKVGGVVKLNTFLLMSYETSRAALFNLLELVLWQPRPTGFLATRFVGKSLGLEPSPVLWASLVSSAGVLLIYLSALIVLAKKSAWMAGKAKLKVLMSGFVFFAIITGLNYGASFVISASPSLIVLQFASEWQRSVDSLGLLSGLLLFGSLALVAMHKRKN
jgi:serine/threonine protein kinase